jgi:hypothetical protein
MTTPFEPMSALARTTALSLVLFGVAACSSAEKKPDDVPEVCQEGDPSCSPGSLGEGAAPPRTPGGGVGYGDSLSPSNGGASNYGGGSTSGTTRRAASSARTGAYGGYAGGSGASSIGGYGYGGSSGYGESSGSGGSSFVGLPGFGGGYVAGDDSGDPVAKGDYLLESIGINPADNKDLEDGGRPPDLLLLGVGDSKTVELAKNKAWQLEQVKVDQDQADLLLKGRAKLMLFDEDDRGTAPPYDLPEYRELSGYLIATCTVSGAASADSHAIACDSRDVAGSPRLRLIDREEPPGS